jgi:hypothetical protein
MTTADLRDRDAEDRDEEAWRRDKAGASRDRDAQVRDQRAEDKMRAAVEYTQLVGHMLDVGQRVDEAQIADQIAVVRDLLSKLEEALEAAKGDRLAARDDRQAAAGDRRLAASDRCIEAAHRGQAAIEREQRAYKPTTTSDRGAELLAAAQAACTRAESLHRHEPDLNIFPPARKDVLRQSMVARLQARLDTLPVIEQAKGIIMAQRRCNELEAFDLLRQASQRLNEPIRDLAARIVTNSEASSAPRTPG